MALLAATVWEIRAQGNDTNGGGFLTGASGTDFSQQDAKRSAGDVTNISVTDGVAAGSTTLVSATANFTAAIVGNIIYVQGGSGSITRDWYQVVTFTNATTIVVDRATGLTAGTGVTINIGGALATPGAAGVQQVSGMSYYIKAGTYSITTNTNNVENGKLRLANLGYIKGYEVTRSDYTGVRPLLSIAVAGSNQALLINAGGFISNINVDCNSTASCPGLFVQGQASYIYACNVIECVAAAFTGGSAGGTMFGCYASGSGASYIGFTTSTSWDCIGCVSVSTNTAGTGYSLASGGKAIHCIASGGSIGYDLPSGVAARTHYCIAYGCSTIGFQVVNANSLVSNCIAESCTTSGFAFTTTTANRALINCAAVSNGTNFNLGAGLFVVNINPITGSGTFFVNAAGGNFALNSTTGAGAAVKAAGFPGVYPGISTTGYLDIGGVQSQGGGLSQFNAPA